MAVMQLAKEHSTYNLMAPKESYRESEWADISPLLKYISGAVAPRLKAPSGPYQASLIKIQEIGRQDN